MTVNSIITPSRISGSGEVFLPVSAAGFPNGIYLTGTLNLTTRTKMTVSFWFKATNHTPEIVPYGSAAFNPLIGINYNNNGTGIFINSPASCDDDGSNDLTPYLDNNWHHCLVSFDGSIPKYQIAIDGKILPLPTGYTFSAPGGSVPVTVYPAFFSTGAVSISELWLLTNVHLDISVQSNVRRFYSASHRPVPLGSNGNLPTGTQAEIYLKGSGTGIVTNSGSAGSLAFSDGVGSGVFTPTTTPSNP